ncbi:MAG: hypothetical protein JWP89_2703 [Schlesneria sp.]|nr:hypothetical protein [Schlesneria sp.]
MKILASVTIVLVCSALLAAEPAWNPDILNTPSIGGVTGGLTSQYADGTDQIDRAIFANRGILLAAEPTGVLKASGAGRLDILVAIDGYRVETVPEFRAAVVRLVPGKETIFTLAKHEVTASGLDYKTITFTAVVPTRREAILASLKVAEDRVTGQRWAKHVEGLTGNGIVPYFQLFNDAATNLRVQIQTVNERLLIPTEIVIRSGDVLSRFPVKFDEVSTDIGGGLASALIDWKVNDEMLDTLTSIAVRDASILRFEARDSKVRDIDLDDEDSQKIADVLVAYKLKGGNIPNEKMKWWEERAKKKDEQAAGVDLKKLEPPKVFMPPASEVAKPKPKPIPPPTEAELLAKKETEAAKKLKLAKTFVERGDGQAATKRLNEIVEQFDGTDAAEQAKRLLKK